METLTQKLKWALAQMTQLHHHRSWAGSMLHQSMTAGVLNPLCAAPLPRPCYTNSQALTALRHHFVPFSKLLRG